MVRSLCSLLWIGLCLSAQESRTTRPSLESRLLEALRSEDPDVRAGAAYFVGHFGSPAHAKALGVLVEDEDVHVRRAAVNALGELRTTDAAPFLLKGLGDGVEFVRRETFNSLVTCARSGDHDEIARYLGDAAPAVRIAAAMTLARLGAEGHSADVAELLSSCSGGWADRQLAYALDLLTEPDHLPALAKLAASVDPWVRDRVAETRARLAPSAESRASSSATRRTALEVGNTRAVARLRELAWREVPVDELRAAAKAARLVIYGETHHSKGPLRDAQIDLLRAFAGHARDHDALGFEPSVESAQKLVIHAAHEFGMRAFPVEREWEKLNPLRRYAERDDEAAAAIDGWLDADPGHRLFVVRGQMHILPEGYLDQRLRHRPLLILSLPHGMMPLSALGDRPRMAGRTFHIGPGNALFVQVNEEIASEKLLAELEKR